jgi:transposase
MNFNVSAGGLTQAWKKLALTLEPVYVGIAKNIKTSAVLNADGELTA